MPVVEPSNVFELFGKQYIGKRRKPCDHPTSITLNLDVEDWDVSVRATCRNCGQVFTVGTTPDAPVPAAVAV